MKIKPTSGPVHGPAKILQMFHHVAAQKRGPTALDGVAAQRISVGVPLRLFELSLTNIAHGDKLNAARPNGFQFFIRVDRQACALAEVSGDHELTQPGDFRQISHGEHTMLMVKTLKRIERHLNPDVVDLHLIRCSPLKVWALVAARENNAGLVIFPVTHLPELTRSEYSEDEFFAALQPLAVSMLQSYQTAAAANGLGSG